MANSSSISDFKEKIIAAAVNDSDILRAFGAEDCQQGSDLINTHIFKYNKSPETINERITFMTLMVHTKAREKKEAFVTSTLEIWIYSHHEHIEMDAAVTSDNRNDYLAMLLDNMLNGSAEYGGIGQLNLVSNEEGVYNKDFLYRRLLFETIDVSHSVCS